MYKTEKQRMYYDEVIRLHFEEGYGTDRIENILPIGHSTANRWINNFVAKKGKDIVIRDGDDRYHFCYLSLIMDAYSEEIVGWSVGPTLENTYPLEALKMALKRIDGSQVHLIHHSDRGCQYASKDYVNILKSSGINISMTESGDPKDNAQSERINNTMKNELLKDKVFWNISEVTTSVAAAVDFYNNQRPHMSVGMMTPTEASYATGERDMKWYSLRQAAIKRSDLEAVNSHCSLPHSYQRLTSDLRSSVNL